MEFIPTEQRTLSCLRRDQDVVGVSCYHSNFNKLFIGLCLNKQRLDFIISKMN